MFQSQWYGKLVKEIATAPRTDQSGPTTNDKKTTTCWKPLQNSCGAYLRVEMKIKDNHRLFHCGWFADSANYYSKNTVVFIGVVTKACAPALSSTAVLQHWRTVGIANESIIQIAFWIVKVCQYDCYALLKWTSFFGGFKLEVSKGQFIYLLFFKHVSTSAENQVCRTTLFFYSEQLWDK